MSGLRSEEAEGVFREIAEAVLRHKDRPMSLRVVREACLGGEAQLVVRDLESGAVLVSTRCLPGAVVDGVRERLWKLKKTGEITLFG